MRSRPKSTTSSKEARLTGVTLNIGAAAVERATSILSWLHQRRDDVIILTETSPGAGTELLAHGLAREGYNIISTPPHRDRGAMIATRLPVHRRLCAELEVTLPWRMAAVVLDTSPRLAIVGIYVPSRDRSAEKIARKEQFIDSFLAALGALPKRLRSHLVVAGDYNVVSRRHEPPRKGYFQYEYDMHETLEHLGLVAGHDLTSASESAQPHSWIGRTGDGYLYDYIHLGEAVQPRLTACQYLHVTRQKRLSDHAAVAFACDLDKR